jgi:hypothetical protein
MILIHGNNFNVALGWVLHIYCLSRVCFFLCRRRLRKVQNTKKCVENVLGGAAIHHRGLIFLWRALKIATLSRLGVIYRLGQYAN